jgi:Zn-finger nucleic acid-binding protein
MLQGTLRDIPLHECPKCFGLWLDTQTFERICQDAEKRVAVLGRAQQLGGAALQPVRYLPCADCGQLMHRMNFAKCSGVIVDVCRPHGIWFDVNELHRIVQFIHNGGLERSRARDKSELVEERRRLRDTRDIAGGSMGPAFPSAAPDLLTEIISAAGDLFIDWL